MRSILEAFRKGSGRERLSVLSDIFSIVGVSVVTVVGGAFALDARLNVDNIAGVLVGGLLCLAIFAVVVGGFLTASSWFNEVFRTNSNLRLLAQISIWSVFLAAVVYAAFFAYAVLSTVSFVRQ